MSLWGEMQHFTALSTYHFKKEKEPLHLVFFLLTLPISAVNNKMQTRIAKCDSAEQNKDLQVLKWDLMLRQWSLSL